jgi:hypothetical protein
MDSSFFLSTSSNPSAGTESSSNLRTAVTWDFTSSTFSKQDEKAQAQLKKK